MDLLNQAYEELNKEYCLKRNEIISKLISIRDGKVSSKTKTEWINQTIDFLKEVKYAN